MPAKTEEQRLGIATLPPSATLATQIGLKKDEGIVVERVDADAPVAKIGLKKYDVLVQIDGKPVPSNPIEFRKLLAALKTDTPVDAVVVRAGKPETAKGLSVPADMPAAAAPVKEPKETKEPK